MNKIKFYRQKLGLTIKELAEKSNVAVGYVSELENDVQGIKNPSKDVMIRIAEGLAQSVPDVFFPNERLSIGE